jgi:hypothetical protein
MVKARRKPEFQQALNLSRELLDEQMLLQTACARLVAALGFIPIETDFSARALHESETEGDKDRGRDAY